MTTLPGPCAVGRHAGAAFRTIDLAPQLGDVGRFGCHRLGLRPGAPPSDDLGVKSRRGTNSPRHASQCSTRHSSSSARTSGHPASSEGLAPRADDANAVPADRFRKGRRAAVGADVIATRIQRHGGTAIWTVHARMIARTRRVGESAEPLIVCRWPIHGGHGHIIQTEIHRQLTAMMRQVVDRIAHHDMPRMLRDGLRRRRAAARVSSGDRHSSSECGRARPIPRSRGSARGRRSFLKFVGKLPDDPPGGFRSNSSLSIIIASHDGMPATSTARRPSGIDFLCGCQSLRPCGTAPPSTRRVRWRFAIDSPRNKWSVS